MLKLSLLAGSLALLSTGAAAQSLPYLESFEGSNGGYTTSGTNTDWEHGVPSGSFIPRAADGTEAWVTELTGASLANQDSLLISPVFDFTGLTEDPTLQFAHIFEMESFGDQSWVELSINGGPFTKLGTSGGGNAVANWYNDTFNDWWDGNSGNPGDWRTARHPITGGAGNTVQLRWVYETDFSTNLEGIGIDSVAIFDELDDVRISALSSPSSGPLGDLEPIIVLIENLGSASVSGFDVSYTVTDPNGVVSTATETFTDTIGPLGTRAFTFLATVDMSAVGTHTIVTSTELVGDENPLNDTLTSQVISVGTVTSFPYLEGFESGDGQFITYGTASSWERGIPVGSFIQSAATGQQAWVTNPTGFYNLGEDSYLEAPPFDCTGMTHDPMLRFEHIYQLDFSDNSIVEVSINGSAWAKLGLANDPGSLNWYNDTFSNHWDGSSGLSGVWRTAQHIIPGGAGNIVSVRWRLDNNTSFLNEDGVGIDDVELFEAPFDLGQAPQPNLSTLDINDSLEAVGFPVSAGYPGPYYVAVSASSGETLDFTFGGPPNQPIVLIGGDLSVGVQTFAGGQLDVADRTVWASGLIPTGINQLFFTNAFGDMTLSVTIPQALIGQVITYQAAVVNSQGFALSNAIQVTVLP